MIVVAAWTLLCWTCSGAPAGLAAASTPGPARHELVYEPDTAAFAALPGPVGPPAAYDEVDVDALLAKMTSRHGGGR
jgi:hypothetical protein